MDRTRMDKQYDFLREIDKEKSIFRQTYLADRAAVKKMTRNIRGILR